MTSISQKELHFYFLKNSKNKILVWSKIMLKRRIGFIQIIFLMIIENLL